MEIPLPNMSMIRLCRLETLALCEAERGCKERREEERVRESKREIREAPKQRQTDR